MTSTKDWKKQLADLSPDACGCEKEPGEDSCCWLEIKHKEVCDFISSLLAARDKEWERFLGDRLQPHVAAIILEEARIMLNPMEE